MVDLAIAPSQTSDPDRTITVRRVDFEEVFAHLGRSFTADDDIITAHLLAALSGLFPDGEELFIESVRHFRDEITDEALLKQVNAFIGQEVTHGRQHRRLNDRLGELGYRAKLVERTMQFDDDALTPGMRRVIWLGTRVGPLRGLLERLDEQREHGSDPMFKLALTAALEHYTATMAELLLTEPRLQAMFADEAFFRLWAWHAIEESEHRAVAFDVYRAVGGIEETRSRAMHLAGLALVFIAGYHTVAGVLTDRRSYRGFGLPKSLWRLRTNPLLSRRFRDGLRDYYRPDFHPLQRDTADLEAVWRAWLDDDGPRP